MKGLEREQLGAVSEALADDGLSAFLGGGRSPVDASAKAAAVGFFDYNGAVSCLPDGYAAFADGFIDIGERTLYD